MPQHDTPLSPEHRYAMRLMQMSKKDPQVGQLIPNNDLREKAMEDGLTLDRVMGVFLDGYTDRPALGERSYEHNQDPITGKRVRNYLPDFKTTSYGEFHDRIKAISMAWRTNEKCLVKPDDFVMIIGFTDLDFLSLDMACTYSKATTVPVQSSTSGADLNEMVANIEPVVIATTLKDLPLAAQLSIDHSSVDSIVVFNYDKRVDEEKTLVNNEKARISGSGRDIYLCSIDDLIEEGRSLEWSYLPEQVNDLERRGAIIYSSGSTGTPKGAVISRKAIVQNWLGRKTSLPRITMHLAPLNHILGRFNAMITLGCGGTGYFTLQPDLSSLLEDIRIARPTYMSLFPRIFELVYQHYQNEVSHQMRSGEGERETVEEKVQAKMRSSYLGDRLLGIVYGSAPTSPKVQKFMRECFDVLMIEGYGNTESGTGNLTVENRINREFVLEYKLRDVPELGYYTSDKPFPRGELCVKTKFGIKEYYKQPEETAKLFDEEGYSCTGDIVEERSPDEVVIIDRRKDVIKLSHGEYVAVGTLGTKYEASSALIHQIYIYGNSHRSYLVAAVVVEEALLKQLLGEDASTSDVKNLIRDEFAKVAQLEDLKPFEVPRDFIVENEPFSQKNGLLSSVRKRLRPALKQKYGKKLERLYEEKESADNGRILEVKNPESTLTTVEKLVILLENQLNIEITDPESSRNFNTYGGDSLGASLFSMTIEEVFDVLLPADVLLDPSGNLAKWAEQIEIAQNNKDNSSISFNEIHGKGSKVVQQSDLSLDRFLSTDFFKHANSIDGTSNLTQTVLLTGANGYLGHRLAFEWLQEVASVGGKLICLVRAENDQKAFDKLADQFKGKDPVFEEEFCRLSESHLTVIAGDVSKVNLGLSEVNFIALAQQVDRICHVAALVNHRLGYQHLFGPNVVGTSEVIRLALTSKKKAIDFISTAGVFNLLENPSNVSEQSVHLAEVQLSERYASGYATSKWAGELLLKEASERFELPINIFRCNMILPDRELNGVVNKSDMLSRMLYSMVKTGLVPVSFYQQQQLEKQPHYDGIAVDVLAKAVVKVYQKKYTDFKVYHSINYLKDDVSMDSFVSWIASAGYSITKFEDHSEWYDRISIKLKALPEEERQLSALDILMAFQKPIVSGQVNVDCRNFIALVNSIEELGEIPHLDEAYIHKYLDDLSAIGMMPIPKKETHQLEEQH